MYHIKDVMITFAVSGNNNSNLDRDWAARVAVAVGRLGLRLTPVAAWKVEKGA